MTNALVPEPYQLVRVLGQGGFGEVSLVRESATGRELAIKRLARLEPSALVRFKNEFRLLQGLRHPALARLHELIAWRDGWYIVMEYVRGEDFTQWVRPGGEACNAATMPDVGGQDVAGTYDITPYDEARLRSALRGLARGLVALHEAGLIHRDVKPPNVLVGPDGRVVILDFGLAATVTDDVHHSFEAKTMGTPGYIAPEQAQAQPVTRAVDWYAVGVMLFEALTGRRPFVGSIFDIVRAQLSGAPPDPAQFGRAVPEDLRALCMRLLAADPAERPDGAAVLAALGDEPAPAPRRAEPLFVGRTAELDVIRTAFDDLIRTRAPQAVHVVGSSGLGKSALVRRAVADASERHDAVVLDGRCYEREALPYKAIDPLIDALTNHLRRLPTQDVLAVMPRDVLALCRLFPALGQVEELARAPESEKVENLDELRRRAVSALRELLARIADRKPVLIAIDDLQWGCLDSARLLSELLAPPSPPRLLAILSYRPQDQTPNAALALLRDRLNAHRIEQRTIVLGPLAEAEAEQLARELLPGGAEDELVRRVARESGCSPLFVGELARVVTPASTSVHVGLDQVIADRVAKMPAVARQMLELVSVAARGIDLAAVCEAASVSQADAAAALTALEEANLVRHVSSEGRLIVEPIHDRIREVVASQLGADALVEHHLALAEALVRTAGTPETIAEHFRLAGQPDRARPHALRAADAAIAALAHDRAIALYRLALEGSAGRERFDILLELGEALAYDARGLEASATFQQAIALAPTPIDAVELRNRVAHQLLGSGRVDDGLDAVDDLLEAAHLTIPTSPRRAVMSLLYQRLRLRLRGLDFKQRRIGELSREVMSQIDTCWTVGMGLTGVDLLRAANAQSRHLRLALEAGEPYRIARGLALEVCLLALDGPKGQARAAAILPRAEELAHEVGHPHAMAWASGGAAVAAWCVGRWREAVGLASYSIALLRSRCMDVGWEICSLDVWFRMRSLLALGQISTVLQDAATVDREAERRADVYALTLLRTAVSPTCRFVTGDPAGATTIAHDAIAAWSNRGWHFQHQEVLRTECVADLYAGDPGRALERIAERWPAMTSSMMLRIQNQRIQMHALQALAAVRAGGKHNTRLARQRSAQLLRERNPWGAALGLAIAGRLAAAGKTDDAPARLEAAEHAFTELEMPLHAATMRRTRGTLVGGDEGRSLIEHVDRELAELGVSDPARLADWLAS